jgi:lysophospholipase L1-like esterase
MVSAPENVPAELGAFKSFLPPPPVCYSLTHENRGGPRGRRQVRDRQSVRAGFHRRGRPVRLRPFVAAASLALIICLGALAAPAFAAPGSASSPPTFADVPATHPYFPAIEGMAADGVLEGYLLSDRREFDPDANVTRAQFAKMIVRALGLNVTEQDICPFVDVWEGAPADLYPDHYIAVAAGSHITEGYDSTHYGPSDSITRAQAVTMVARAAAAVSAPLATPPSAFGTLGDFSADHAVGMAKAEYGVLLAGLVGFGPWWSPWQPASRGEVAEILWRLRYVVSSGPTRSPDDVLQDLLQDQKLDGPYRRDELQGFLDDSAVCTTAGAHRVRLVREELQAHPRFGRVMFDGDSLTAGSCAKTPYPTRLMAAWPRSIPWKNIAIGGETLQEMLKNAPQTVDPFYSAGEWRNVVVLWAGTNDIALWNHSNAQIFRELEQYALGRRAQGFTVVVLTLLPRSDVAVQAVPDFEARRLELNQMIRSRWEEFADLMIDVGADSRVGQAGDEQDRTYYTVDRVHLNDNGQQLVADLVGAELHRLEDWAGLLR